MAHGHTALPLYPPCRATGEGVGPQEYTLIKMKVLELRGPLAALEGALCCTAVLCGAVPCHAVPLRAVPCTAVLRCTWWLRRLCVHTLCILSSHA